MENNIKNILDELYKIDPNLREKEENLIKIIAEMIILKPNIKVNQNFKNELREKLYSQIVTKKYQKTNNKPNIWQILTYIFGWVWIAAFSFIFINKDLILNNEVVNTKISEKTDNKTSINTASLPLKTTKSENKDIEIKKIDKLENKKIENITPKPKVKIENNIWSLETKDNLENIQNDISTSNLENNIPESDMALDSVQSEQYKVQWVFWSTNSLVQNTAKYVFSWSLNDILKSQMDVYSQIKTKNNTFIENKDIDLTHSNLDSLVYSQNNENWYYITIDNKNNYIRIEKNYEYWKSQNSEDLNLTNEEILKTANDFLNTFKINTQNYWSWIIQKDSLESNYNTQKEVTYPFIIDWKKILLEDWSYKWIKITVDLKENKVISMYWLDLNNYIKTLYDVENNEENILKSLNKNTTSDDKNLEIINLSNPKIEYISKYMSLNWVNKEYLIPAIIFEKQWSDKLIIPLVK